MAAPVIFITSQYMMEKGMVDSNVDVGLITPNIEWAQDNHIQFILGENLYQSLMTQQLAVNNGGSWNSAAYQNLVEEYIQPALMWWSIYEGMDFIQFKITNKTITQQTSDHSTGGQNVDIDRLKSSINTRAGFYTQRIREQIINNTQSFPEYFVQQGVERIVPIKTEYNGGFGLRFNRFGAGGYYRGCCWGDGIGIRLN